MSKGVLSRLAWITGDPFQKDITIKSKKELGRDGDEKLRGREW